MDDDQVLGYIIFLGSLAGVVVYFWLIFLSSWSWRVIQVSAYVAVLGVLVIVAWIGYTLMTTPPPMPLEDFDFEFDVDEEETGSEESREAVEPVEET